MPLNDTKRDSGEITPNHDPDMNLNDHESQPQPSQTETSEESEPEPHSIYTAREKWCIVALIAFGGLFSPLSSNIYFPVIPTLSEVFHKSIELINLTVTMYIVFQGLAPMFWGTLADSYGRRLMFIACLLLLAISCIGLALVPTNDYWLLLFLRCFQAAGSASTIALGAGVIGDISEPAERAGFFGVYNIGPLVGPAIGPVLGGVLADKLGWRSIFWFLCIASAACAVVLILLLPETLRALVGNGSIPPPGPPLIARPLLPLIGRRRKNPTQAPLPSRPHKPFRNPLRLLLNLDILILLFFNGVICAVFYGVNASISTIFHETYPQLGETELGLCFLAIGGGMLIGSAGSGKLLDWDYQRVKRSILAETSEKSEQNYAFPIEQARMRLMPILVAFYIASCTGYGWCIEKKVSLAGPLILLIGVGIFSMAVMNATQTLILDLVPGQGSSVTACNNLVRCALSATMVACIQLILTPLGVGWTYTLLSGMCVAASPLIYVVMRIGPGCRAKRRRRSGGGEAIF
ncbi:MFS general substrate transporter [Mycena metata]|uniref:MFS general substrate transporter n=1 Tax=Mycena metata TaxID=1033252 RepID=A0AAD7JH81_9AGAR|nr:MFS general substrate transporter [Mycena metata]